MNTRPTSTLAFLAAGLLALNSACHAAGVSPPYTDNYYSNGPQGIVGYGDITLDPSGNVYAVLGNSTVYFSSAGSGTWSTLATTAGAGMALELDGFTLYVGLNGSGEIYTLDLSSTPPITPVLFGTIAGTVTGLARNCDGIFLAASSSQGVYQLDGGGVSAQILPGLFSGLACTASDEIIVSNESADTLVKIQLPSSSVPFASNLLSPTDIAVHPGTGNIYVAEENHSVPLGGTIEELDPFGARLNDTFATDIGFDWGWVPSPMDFSVDGTQLWYLWEDIPSFSLPSEVRFIDGFPPPGPTCTLTLQSATPVTDLADLELTPDSSSGVTGVDATFEFSTDAGSSWTPATPAPGSTNPMLGAPIGGPSTYQWNSRADAVGTLSMALGVLVRATVDDGVGTGTCLTSPFDVDNTSLCPGTCGDCDKNGAGPDVLDALTGAQIAAGLITPTPAQDGCCDVDSSLTITVLDSLTMAQSSAGLPATLTCP